MKKRIKSDKRYQSFIDEMAKIGGSFSPNELEREKANGMVKKAGKYPSLAELAPSIEYMRNVSEGGFGDKTPNAPFGGYKRAKEIIQEVNDIWGREGMVYIFDDISKKLPKNYAPGPLKSVFEGVGGWHN